LGIAARRYGRVTKRSNVAIDPNTEHHITLSKHLIENAKQERERLLEQIAASQKTIEQSLKLIARLDAAIAQAENEKH
jgi:hypothetical protein